MGFSGHKKNTEFTLGDTKIDGTKLVELASGPNPNIAISAAARTRVKEFRKKVEDALEKKIYGINTGFGLMSDVAIAKKDLETLQVNLVRSHCCGVGEPLGEKETRALLILRVHSFLLGSSGVREELIDKLMVFLREDLLPYVPVKGSVGASGDLAPLSHLALPLLGEGFFRKGEDKIPAADALSTKGISSLTLQAKEGLSLINGTHFMSTLAAFANVEARILAESADVVAKLSLSGFKGTKTAFDPRIHALKPHPGQTEVAGSFWQTFSAPDSLMESHADCDRVQDPYSFRCIPQVHGASRDALEYCQKVVDTELNSVTDNPLVCENGDVLSGGNFHGAAVGMAMDFLAIAMAELGSISERRLEKLINPALSGLPPFLVKDSGLNSGFMIPHVTAAALVSENKVLCHPASVDSIPTSADKEDHVSMGPIAARKAREVIRNVSRILAIELIAACQAIDLHTPHKPNAKLEKIYDQVRQKVSFMEKDSSLYEEIETLGEWILQGGLVSD